ncbi:hypothetical protein Hanom_Chr10g00916311 [Helianthus anomalus]
MTVPWVARPCDFGLACTSSRTPVHYRGQRARMGQHRIRTPCENPHPHAKVRTPMRKSVRPCAWSEAFCHCSI